MPRLPDGERFELLRELVENAGFELLEEEGGYTRRDGTKSPFYLKAVNPARLMRNLERALAHQQKQLREEEVKVMANAIGYALFHGDGRDVRVVDGVETIDVNDWEKQYSLDAAERAWTHLNTHRARTP